MKLYGLAFIITSVATVLVQSTLYRFIADDLFQDCTEETQFGGFKDFVELKDVDYIFDDEGLHVNGSFTVVWDVTLNDHIMMYAELRKAVRYTWQSTPLSVQITDFCKDMSNPDSYIYEFWSKHLFPEDFKCFNKGSTYRHNPFTIKLEAEALVNLEGRYKVVVKYLKGLNDGICAELVGDIIRV
uniref:MD-2-related lipid-recognition domain-containing protein n=1 Tax=Glossina brevipalpis TaxID=37001 RepID=A0A1A9X3V6_9MUSC